MVSSRKKGEMENEHVLTRGECRAINNVKNKQFSLAETSLKGVQIRGRLGGRSVRGITLFQYWLWPRKHTADSTLSAVQILRSWPDLLREGLLLTPPISVFKKYRPSNSK